MPPYVSQKKYSLDPIELKFSQDDMSNHMRVTNQEKKFEKKQNKIRQYCVILGDF